MRQSFQLSRVRSSVDDPFAVVRGPNPLAHGIWRQFVLLHSRKVGQPRLALCQRGDPPIGRLALLTAANPIEENLTFHWEPKPAGPSKRKP